MKSVLPPARADAAQPAAAPPGSRMVPALPRDRWLWLILGVALGLRLAIWWLAPYRELLGDEREYYSAAAILADGRGLAFIDQALWVRPPLYIGFLAGLFRLFGASTLPVWLAQTALSTATVGLVYLLAWLLYARRDVARLAAGVCAVYLPFAVYTRLLLSETLFNAVFVGAFAALALFARRGGRAPLVVAGLALGLACLTRGIALPFVALAPVWLAIQASGRQWRAVARQSALVVGCALLVVAPWTARNALAYGRLIPVETTGGYNFWLGALDGRQAGQIENTLREIPNQADRQMVAYARGWAVVRADPAAYLARAARELADLWTINFSAYERLTKGFAHGLAPRPWLVLTLLLDDLLYLVALPLAVLGWVWTGRREDRWLLGLWIGYSCLTAAVFFAISRFRAPVLPFVFVLAARGAVALPCLRAAVARVPRCWLIPALAAIAIAALVYPTFEPGLYQIGFAAAGAQARLDRGYTLLAHGDPVAALAEFERLPPAFYATPTALAAAYHAQGQDERALAILDDARDPLGAALLRGDIARARGDRAAALRAFNARDLRIANPTALAWEQLSPPPIARLDVGSGLDLGYLRDFALDEREPDGTTLRWTGSHAELRLTPAVTGPATLRLRLKGYRPRGAPPPLRLLVDGRPVAGGPIAPDSGWQVYERPITVQAGRTVVVRLDTPTFVPGYADQRQLGVMVDWVEIAPPGSSR